ncbi:GGDEF domain-containing protein [Lutibaculum baratangense]|uniref:Periplasmic/7TM domain sensor diguanylate cyclase n=1 Tax=Lutibaculum baratangense AMV1 TaxID=631454 RepID=V4RH33_9HYPH|nr:GGDEF domain-containing protein [Lutibaculum baratangense]ESR22600.1 periplasmic/7TM domain sensor diguanylate cyclase [Lutibaculum baratangense AMV1]
MLPDAQAAPSPATHRRLVELLFTNLVPILITGVAQALVAGLILYRHQSIGMAVLLAAGLLATAARIAMTLAYRRWYEPADFRKWERVYAALTCLFAAILGGTVASAFAYPDAVGHMLAIALLYSHVGGLMARVAPRPRMCRAAILLATLPAAAAIATHWEASYLGLSALTLIMLFGGLDTARHIGQAVRKDIEAQQRLEQLAHSDRLTGLPNRIALEEKLESLLARPCRDGRTAIHFLDLDRFKAANDEHGHAMGDALLKAVADRLRRTVRDTDFPARLGGDEFVVVQDGIQHLSEVEFLARRITRTLEEPFYVQGATIRIGATIGIAIAADGAHDPHALIGRADAALYQAKRDRRGSVVVSGTAS